MPATLAQAPRRPLERAAELSAWLHRRNRSQSRSAAEPVYTLPAAASTARRTSVSI